MLKNTTTIQEIRFLFHAAKASQELLDNAIAQVFTETIEDLENHDIKRTVNLYVAHHAGQFEALLHTIAQGIYGVFPISAHDQSILLALSAKIKSIQHMYDGFQVAVPNK